MTGPAPRAPHGTEREVYVFVPYARANGRMESPEYDTPLFRDEVASWFEPFGLRHHWVPITVGGAARVVAEVARRHGPAGCLVVNLCDGDERTGFPGLSVVQALEAAGLAFTGASSWFYEVTTAKTEMKAHLLAHGVPTPPFAPLHRLPEDAWRLGESVGFPVIVKPDVGAASHGLGLGSVAETPEAAVAWAKRLLAGPIGCFDREAGLFAERFVAGPEYTVLVVADRSYPGGVRAYPPAERVFHSALPPCERFLSYDRYWALYREETKPEGDEPFCRYESVPEPLAAELCRLALRAFGALSGTGYARVDVRMDAETGTLFVLEVNSNCGLSRDPECSAGQILRLAGAPIEPLIAEVVADAIRRQGCREQGEGRMGT